MVSVRCMRPGLPGGKVITAKRVPFGGGGVPRMRAPTSSTCSPTGISAGSPSVIQISVDCAPDAPPLWLAASPSMITLATLLSSWPVTTRRIGGYFGCSELIACPSFPFGILQAPKPVPQRRLRVTMARSQRAFCCCERHGGCGNLYGNCQGESHADATLDCPRRPRRRRNPDPRLCSGTGQAEGRHLAARLLGQLIPRIRRAGGLPQGSEPRRRVLLH